MIKCSQTRYHNNRLIAAAGVREYLEKGILDKLFVKVDGIHINTAMRNKKPLIYGTADITSSHPVLL